ncbi:hypothetical protein [Streptomyces sp. CBMA156]|uniref:hypothetical protein n=1 Tax=Streptomyces sp. CBMA156 TaxID=1930280 RepID=UPI0016619EA6|nr:hypothetical protein [Streptomyces sp. CBMA156]MBD0673976.1 hypothetical protein [Streptomyces sp. CBMA156]
MLTVVDAVRGPGLDTSDTPWADHAAAMADQWLHDFAWRGMPLAEFVTGIDVSFQSGPATPLWRSKGLGHPLPSDPAPTELGSLDNAPFDMWHLWWFHLVGAWHLTGTWLHPETSFSIDQFAFAEQQAHLYVGCHDRENPTAPRRYDPSLNPVTNDQGVVVFPLRTFRTLDFHAAGYGPEASMLLCAGTAVAESAIHEALEMHQLFPGQPVLDPHIAGLTIDVTVHWASGTMPTTGWAHAQ